MAACCASKKLRYVFGALLIAFGAMLIVMTQLSAETLGGETPKALLEVTGAVGTCVFGVLGLFTEGVYFSENKHVMEDEKLMGKRGIFNLKFAGRIVGLLGLLTGPLLACCSPIAAVSVTGGGCFIWLLTCIPQLNYSWISDDMEQKIKARKDMLREQRQTDAANYKKSIKILKTAELEKSCNVENSKFTKEDIEKAKAFCETYEKMPQSKHKLIKTSVEKQAELELNKERLLETIAARRFADDTEKSNNDFSERLTAANQANDEAIAGMTEAKEKADLERKLRSAAETKAKGAEIEKMLLEKKREAAEKAAGEAVKAAKEHKRLREVAEKDLQTKTQAPKMTPVQSHHFERYVPAATQAPKMTPKRQSSYFEHHEPAATQARTLIPKQSSSFKPHAPVKPESKKPVTNKPSKANLESLLSKLNSNIAGVRNTLAEGKKVKASDAENPATSRLRRRLFKMLVA